MKKTIVVGGLTKDQREKELEKIKKKHEKKGYQFLEYIDNGMLKSVAIFEVSDEIIKKEKSNKLVLAGILFMIIAFVLYMQTSNDIKSYKINKDLKTLSVSDFKYTFKNEPAVSISIGESNNNYITITVHRKNVYEGFKTSSKDEISSSAVWNKLSFFQNHNSTVSFEITKLDKVNKKAEILFTSKLYTSNEKSSLLDISTRIMIKDKNFTNLISNP